jgi:hypothetical protein
VAKESVSAREYPPGAMAPSGGTYEQCSVLGALTGVRITVARGQALPTAPRGFTWRVIELPPGCDAAD